MTHYLKDFTELLPQRPSLEELKAEFLLMAEAQGMNDFLWSRAISKEMVKQRVEEEITNLMTANVASIIKARGLLDQDQIEFLGFVHEDPGDDFVAAVRDAVQVSFVYDAAQKAFKDEEREYQRAQKSIGPREDVQKFVVEIATSHPALAGPSKMHALDEMIAGLHASAPWMSDVSIWVYKALRAQYSTGNTWLNLPPVILIGPPGCGKSTYARTLATLCGVPIRALDAAASNASFTVAGSDATWSKSQAGVPLQEIAKTGIANPVMIVDEIEKAGTMTANGGSRVSLPDALLGAEERIRTKLLKDGHIDTVIGLPANLFYSTGIPVCILVLKKCKKPDDVLFINAAEHFSRGKRQNQLEDGKNGAPDHIGKIVSTYQFRTEEDRYSKRVSMDRIAEEGYNLNISRYISTAVPEEAIKLEDIHRNLVENETQIRKATSEHNTFLKELGLSLLP